MTARRRAEGLLLLAAVLFSTGGAAIKIGAFTPFQVSAGRSGVAALTLWLLARPRFRWSGGLVLAAMTYAATLTLTVLATRLTTAANAIFLQSAAPLYLMVIGPAVLGERLRRSDVVSAGVMALGLVSCFLAQPVATVVATDPARGNLLALASSVTWALTLTTLRHRGRQGDDRDVLAIVVLGNAIACLAILPWAWPFPSAAPSSWLVLVYLGAVQVGLAYACLAIGLRHVPAFDASLLLLIEPVLNPCWTWLVRGEQPGIGAIVGGACILAATAGKAWADRRTG